MSIEMGISSAARPDMQQAFQLPVPDTIPQYIMPENSGEAVRGKVTFYACLGNGYCGTGADGTVPISGHTAACGSNYGLGTRFIISGDSVQRIWTCTDRGLLAPTQVDVFFYDAADGWIFQSELYAANNGTVADITVVP